jgi:hypothetical protein
MPQQAARILAQLVGAGLALRMKLSLSFSDQHHCNQLVDY